MIQTKKSKFSGWSVFIGCVLLMVFPGGLLSYTPGLFMYPICQELGLSTASYGLSTTLSSIANAFVSMFIVQYLSKGKKGTMKAIILLSAVISCGGFMARSACTELWQIYLMTVVQSIGYNMLTYVPVSMMINNWFIRKNSTLIGLAFAGTNLGGAIFSTVIGRTIESQGWRFSFVFGGAICLVVSVIAVLLIKRSPAEYGQSAYGEGEEEVDHIDASQQKAWLGISKKQAMKTPALYLLCVALVLTGIYATGVSVNSVSYLCENAAFTISEAGTVMTVFTLAALLGTSIGGAIIGKIGLKNAILAAGASIVIALIALTYASTFKPLAYVWAIFHGLSILLAILVPPMMVSAAFGAKDYTGIYGFINAFYLVGCGVAIPVVAFIAESTSYQIAWISMIVVVVSVALLHIRCISIGKHIKEQYPD